MSCKSLAIAKCLIFKGCLLLGIRQRDTFVGAVLRQGDSGLELDIEVWLKTK